MTKNDKNWQKLTKNDKKWQKMTKNDKKLQKLIKIDKNWQKMVKNWPQKRVKNDQKMTPIGGVPGPPKMTIFAFSRGCIRFWRFLTLNPESFRLYFFTFFFEKGPKMAFLGQKGGQNDPPRGSIGPL